MGASMDYRRERFTMDDAYVRAVMRFFVHLWPRGWIYHATRIINWCPFHQTLALRPRGRPRRDRRRAGLRALPARGRARGG